MNIELLFFASLRERLGLASERLALPADVQTVGACLLYTSDAADE